MNKLRIGLSQCRTPYVAFWADDDFQIPEGIERALCFLEANKEHQSCTAAFASVSTLKKESNLIIAFHPAREEQDAALRITRWAEDFYSTFYSVFRTPTLSRCLDLAATISSYESCRIIPEILLGQLALLYGRQGSIPDVSILYQVHATNDSRIIRPVHDDNAFADEYARYRDGLGLEFQKVLHLPPDQSRQLVDTTFRLVYRWTGGRFWIYKKLVENLRRTFKRAFPGLARPRRSGQPLTKAEVRQDDPKLDHQSIRVAIQLVTAFPTGMPLDRPNPSPLP